MKRPGLSLVWLLLLPMAARAAEFRAGASRVDITPSKFPVLVNGGFLQAKADKAATPLYAKGLALDDGKTRIVFVVVDSCMVPRELIDQAKAVASPRAGVPTDRILVSSTHTHTAPAAMGALGCPADPGYVAFLPGKIAEAIEKAVAALAPAEVGYSSVDAPEYTHTRRWIRKADKMVVDPFGKPTGRAHMHPGYRNPDAIHPSGPSDPSLTVMAVRSPGGKPLAILANYSMHYFGAAPLSADYFGRFGESIRQLVGGDASFVGIMSQGTSGDQHWMDYNNAKTDLTLDVYADAVAAKAFEAYRSIPRYESSPTLAMATTTLKLRRRVPDEARLAWAREVVKGMGDRVPKSIPEVYAKEAIYLHEVPERELVLQTLRVGDLHVNAIPNEVYAISGLKLKHRSPFPVVMNIELANGGEGYIPPPEQHDLGGYTTWPARTAALEVQAEPRIVGTLVGLYERLGAPAHPRETKIERRKPVTHFYELDDIEGNLAADTGSKPEPARYEGPYALHLDGQAAPLPQRSTHVGNRFAYLAGGRLVVPGPNKPAWSLNVYFWSGLAPTDRDITGTLLAADNGETLAIGGKSGHAGKLVYTAADGTTLVGKADVKPRTWHHLTIDRSAGTVEVRLDETTDLSGKTGESKPARSFGIGGGAEASARFEGLLDAIVLDYDR